MEARGRTAEKALAACVFQDGGDTMEVILEADLANTPEDVQQQLYKEFEALVQSIQINTENPSDVQLPKDVRRGGRRVSDEKPESAVPAWLRPVLALLAAAIIVLIIYLAGR